MRNHFPTTQLSWIDTHLATVEEGGSAADRARHALQTHVMERYRDALIAYVRGTSFAHLGEADDLVHEFFARRVTGEEFFVKFRASGLRLRRYLMNGILLLLRERLARQGGQRVLDIASIDIADHHTTSAERAFERAWASAVLARAAEVVAEELATEGDERAWTLFRRHFIDGRTYDEIECETGATEREIRNELRRAARRLDATLRSLLAEDGVSAEGVERELRLILGDE